MPRSLKVASPLVACLMWAPAPAAAQDAAAVIERNEAAALGDLRTIISAEAAYQASNGGFYDTPACLHKPISCIPGYSPQWPTFVDEALGSMKDKDGYRRKFHPKALSQKAPPDASPSSLELYAVTLVPIEPGKTGRRGFCGDADGVLCSTKDASEPRPGPDGRCPYEAKEGKPAGCEVLH